MRSDKVSWRKGGSGEAATCSEIHITVAVFPLFLCLESVLKPVMPQERSDKVAQSHKSEVRLPKQRRAGQVLCKKENANMPSRSLKKRGVSERFKLEWVLLR